MNVALALTGVVAAIAGYVALSYPMLRRVGVRERLLERTILFGTVLFLVQFIVYQVMSLAGLAPLGALLAIAGSYYYVRSTLDISAWMNALIVVALPLAVWSIVGAAALIVHQAIS